MLIKAYKRVIHITIYNPAICSLNHTMYLSIITCISIWQLGYAIEYFACEPGVSIAFVNIETLMQFILTVSVTQLDIVSQPWFVTLP